MDVNSLLEESEEKSRKIRELELELASKERALEEHNKELSDAAVLNGSLERDLATAKDQVDLVHSTWSSLIVLKEPRNLTRFERG